mgnify:FL=1
MKIYIYIISLLCTIFTFTDVKAQPVHERYPSAHKNRLNSPNNEIIINQTNTYRDEINSTDRYGNTYGENTSDVYYKLTLTTKA